MGAMKKSLTAILVTTLAVTGSMCAPKDDGEYATETAATIPVDNSSSGTLYEAPATTTLTEQQPRAVELEVYLTAPVSSTRVGNSVQGGYTFAWKSVQDTRGCASVRSPWVSSEIDASDQNAAIEKAEAELNTAFAERSLIKIKIEGDAKNGCLNLLSYNIPGLEQK